MFGVWFTFVVSDLAYITFNFLTNSSTFCTADSLIKKFCSFNIK